MAPTALTTEQRAKAQELAESLRPRMELLLAQLSQRLVANSDAPFG